MKFITLNTNDGKERGKIAFYCRVLEVTRQGFYDYLKNRDKPWKYEALAAEMMEIIDEDECNDNARCESMWARMKEELFYSRGRKSEDYTVLTRERNTALTEIPLKTLKPKKLSTKQRTRYVPNAEVKWRS